MEKYLIGFITGILLVIVLLLSTGAIKNQNEIGTYQITTCHWEKSDWVYVTKIDTRTGEIVELSKYHGFKDSENLK